MNCASEASSLSASGASLADVRAPRSRAQLPARLIKNFTEFSGSGRHKRQLKNIPEFAADAGIAQELPRISRIQWCLTHVEHHKKGAEQKIKQGLLAIGIIWE